MEARNKKLSPMEDIILNYSAQGYSSKEIALELGGSKRTVETHKTRILLKLGATNITNAVGIYAKQGLLQ